MTSKDTRRGRAVPADDEVSEPLDLSEPDAESLALAQRIRAEREYLKLNQAQVAEVLGIPRATVSALETGRRRVSGLELKKLAALFGTSGDRLLGHEVDDDPTAVACSARRKPLPTTTVCRCCDSRSSSEGPAPLLPSTSMLSRRQESAMRAFKAEGVCETEPATAATWISSAWHWSHAGR